MKPETAKAETTSEAKTVSETPKGGIKTETADTKVKPEAVKEGVKSQAPDRKRAKTVKPPGTVKEPKAARESKSAKEAKTPAKKTASSTVKKESAKKSAKAPAKMSASRKQEVKAEVHFQFDGKDLASKDVLDRAMKTFSHSHKGVEIKTIELYIVASEGAAYYVVNGEARDEYKLVL